MKKQPKIFKFSLLIALLSCLGLGYYFYNKNAIADEGGAPGGMPQAMPVTVNVIEPSKTQLWQDYSARLEAIEFAEIRPQVSGRITEIKFQDGEQVEKGDILYVIDPRPFEAALNEAKAELSAARIDATLREKELNRAKDLIATNAISRRIYDERVSRAEAANAAVQRAKAMVESAEINVDFAYIKAPISGKIGRAEIKVGNVVEATIGAPVLTSIVSTEKIYADFEVDEQSYLNFIKAQVKNKDEKKDIPVKLFLNGPNGLSFDGIVDSFDNRIDVNNGTIRARAVFDNADGILIPGMFANIQVGSPDEIEVILLTEAAIGTDQDRKFVYVVGENNIAQYREISTGKSQNGKRIITSGLSAGDKVIIDGLMRLRPDMPVAPQIENQKPVQTSKVNNS
ncbi:MAG: efflux RND transporter periplasmic adaptor subunit [Pseudomonadota bacterium]